VVEDWLPVLASHYRVTINLTESQSAGRTALEYKLKLIEMQSELANQRDRLQQLCATQLSVKGTLDSHGPVQH